jgi:hypothetical protein
MAFFFVVFETNGARVCVAVLGRACVGGWGWGVWECAGVCPPSVLQVFCRCVASVLQVCLEVVSSVCQVCSKRLPSVFQVCFKRVSSVFHMCFKCI